VLSPEQPQAFSLWSHLLFFLPFFKSKVDIFLETLKVQITPSDPSKCSQMGEDGLLRIGGVGLLINAFKLKKNFLFQKCFPRSSDSDSDSVFHFAFEKNGEH
jgi:hypothetical protein